MRQKSNYRRNLQESKYFWPTWWIGDWSMEAAEIDQRVGAQVEIGDDRSDGIQLSW